MKSNLSTIALGLAGLLLAGCADLSPTGKYTYKVAEPQKPRHSTVWNGGGADSLQPTLLWKPLPDCQAPTYDVVIYEVAKRWSGRHGAEFVRGAQVYYREGLTECSNKVEVVLKPDQLYDWSVRTRTGSQTSAWATVDWIDSAFPDPISRSHYHGRYWRFHTPRK
jgi:hypothetical protein